MNVRMLRESKRKSDVSRSLSELSILWRKTNPANPETADQPGIKNNPVQESACRLGCVGAPRCGNKETCFYARNSTGTRGDNQGKEK
jgi:hypothetical protein